MGQEIKKINTDLDVGMLELFRGNIIKIDASGNFEAWLPNAINFDIEIMQKYFDSANVRYEGTLRGPWTAKFMGRCKYEDLTNVLRGMHSGIL